MDYAKLAAYHRAHDEFAKQLNLKVEDVRLGYAKTSMAFHKEHKNAAGVAHGGAIFALVDFALGTAACTYGKLVLTAAASISYIKAGTVGPITAEAVEISATRRLATYEVKVIDGDGVLLAMAQATMYRKSEEYPPKDFENFVVADK